MAINGVFNFEKIRDPERWKLRLLELSSDTGSFICTAVGDPDTKKLDSTASNAEIDDDDDRATGQAVLQCDDDEVDGLSCNDEPCSNETDSCLGRHEDPNPNDAREDIESTAQVTNTKNLSFKNFMDYCHDFASAVWKKPAQDRQLYAGLVIGLTEEANGDDERVSPAEDLHTVLQRHRSMFSSSRNDSFTTDPMFKKNDPKTPGRPREKRMMGRTEQARLMKASSSRKRDRQACSFCKMNGCRVSNCILMKGLGGKPLEPHYVSELLSQTRWVTQQST